MSTVTATASAPAPAVSAPAPSAPSSAPSSSPAPSSAPSTSSAPSSGGDTPKAAIGGGDPGAKSVSGTEVAKVEAVKEEIRRHKLKINGQEREYDEAEVVRLAQLSAGAHQKFSEASEMRKSAEQFFEAFMNDPKSVLMHPEVAAKINFRKLAEEYLGTELQREMMTPEERELKDLREYKTSQDKAREDGERTTRETAATQAAAELQQRAAADYDKKITDVLAKTNLPKNAYTVKRVAELLHGALSKGYDLDVPTAVDMVREGYLGDVQALVGGLDGDALFSILGPEVAKKIRKADLAKLKAQLAPAQGEPAQIAATPAARKAPADTGPKNLRPDEWAAMIRKKAGF